jgi:cyclomaltodextrinase / maltogenic alpha-amylase / neopullulanase
MVSRQQILSFLLASALGSLVAWVGCQRSERVADRPNAPDRWFPAARAASDLSEVTAVVQTGASSDASSPASDPAPGPRTVPDWISGAIFYQIFPERFRNGDRANDPTHESLEFPESIPTSWTITPWTSDWYARAEWERESGDNFYENGVFNRRYGGDLQGVLDQLNYLADLGINTIYFNPVFYGRSLHKYDSTSMHHIDPYFGPDPAGDLEMLRQETADPATWQWTSADRLFLELLRQAHRRKIRTVIDGVFNHTGRDFFAFADLRKRQQQSPYQDWYMVKQYDDPQTEQNEFRYQGWWGIDTLPEFANAADGHDLHDGPRQYVMNITRRWMDPNGDGDPSDGIDGWRLDVANEVPIQFWRKWNTLVRQLNPEAYTVAEVWDDAAEFLTEGRFSATMNYHGFAYPVKGFLIDGRLSPREFGRQLEDRFQDYPPAMRTALQNLIDSHDTDRVASMIVNADRMRTEKRPYAQPDRFDYDVSERVSPRNTDQYDVQQPTNRQRRVQRMVALMQMTFIGAPMIYYGTEAGMWGADDPGDRQPMVWDDLKYDDQRSDPLGRTRRPDRVAFDRSLYQFYRAAIALRRLLPTLREGSFKTLANDDQALFYAFERRLKNERLLVALNRGNKPYLWHPPCDEGESLRQIFCASGQPEQITVERVDKKLVVSIPALEGVVLLSQPQSEP